MILYISMALILSSLIITKSHEVDTDARLIHIFLFVTSSLLKTSWQLVLSVFSQTDLQKLESPTSFTTDVVAALYLIFLVLSVIMLINMLVALLNHTYDNVKVGSTHSNHIFLLILCPSTVLSYMNNTDPILTAANSRIVNHSAKLHKHEANGGENVNY